MKAAVLRGVNKLAIEDGVDLADPGPGEVRVRLVATGVCHGDVMLLRGDMSVPLPMVMGHEGGGVVDAVGPGVSDVEEGDHVVLSITIPCRRCFQCRVGSPELCESSSAARNRGRLLDGTSRLSKGSETLHHYFCQSSFAEFAVVPAGAAVKIRDDVPLEAACLLACGAMTGIGAVVKRRAVRPGESVMILGVGGVGLAAVLGARASGAHPIIAVDRSERALEMGRRLGATHGVNATSDDVVRAVRAITGRGADHAVDAVGGSGTLETCLRSVRPGGGVVVVGMSRVGVAATIDILTLVTQQKRLTGSSAGSVDPHIDITWCIDLYMDGRLPLDKLVTRTYNLDGLPRALTDIELGRTGRGVIIHR